MWKPPRSPIVRYVLPFAAIIAALLAQFGLVSVVPKGVDFPYAIFYLVAILGAAWYGGYGPGAIACLLTVLGLPLLSPPHTLRLSTVDPSRLVLVLGTSLLVSKLSRSQQRMQEMLRKSNDELDQRVRARTGELAHAVEALQSEVEQRKQTGEKLQIQLGRLSLLDQITRLIGERQDLRSIFQVVLRTLEDNMPIDFGCVCLRDPSEEILTVTCIGVREEAMAMELALTEQARIEANQNGLARCVRGQLVYDPDISGVKVPFTELLSRAGLRSMVAAPLISESSVFGVLVAARREPNAFASGDCEFLRQLSEHVALAARQTETLTALQQAYDDLRRTQQSVLEQERLRALGQMASGIAHDINNALSPVALYTEALLDEPGLSERAREYLETTQRAVEDVAHTVGRMREFYRKSDPRASLRKVDINRLVGQVLDLTRARWSDMPLQQGVVIEMRTDLASGLPAVAGIESEIREAFTNLIFNAVDAMPNGGTLTLRTWAADTSAADQSMHCVNFEVRDTGIGMSEETRRRCQEPFFTTKGERGTGLGLPMVYGIAQRHNAEMEIDSEIGVGTAVRLVFPVAVAVEHAETMVAPSAPSRLRILIVDDDPLIIKSLRDSLENEGHLVTTACGGREGIDIIRETAARNEGFAVVITDLGMPYVDGRKIAGAVKMTWKTTPVIMLTGWGQRLVDEDDIPPNVDRVLNKPPKLIQLRTALSELTLNARQQTA